MKGAPHHHHGTLRPASQAVGRSSRCAQETFPRVLAAGEWLRASHGVRQLVDSAQGLSVPPLINHPTPPTTYYGVGAHTHTHTPTSRPARLFPIIWYPSPYDESHLVAAEQLHRTPVSLQNTTLMIRRDQTLLNVVQRDPAITTSGNESGVLHTAY